jgi:hypothetical protein
MRVCLTVWGKQEETGAHQGVVERQTVLVYSLLPSLAEHPYYYFTVEDNMKYEASDGFQRNWRRGSSKITHVIVEGQ